MGITLSAEERLQLQKNALHGGFSIVELPSAENQPMSTYHDIKTGKEIYNLPADPWNVSHYKQRGLILGPLPGKFVPVVEEEETLPANVQEIVNMAVKAALEAVGMVLPDKKEGDSKQTEIEPKQMKMF